MKDARRLTWWSLATVAAVLAAASVAMYRRGVTTNQARRHVECYTVRHRGMTELVEGVTALRREARKLRAGARDRRPLEAARGRVEAVRARPMPRCLVSGERFNADYRQLIGSGLALADRLSAWAGEPAQAAPELERSLAVYLDRANALVLKDLAALAAQKQRVERLSETAMRMGMLASVLLGAIWLVSFLLVLRVNRQLAREVAERQRTEAELERSQAALLRAGRLAAAGQLSAGVAHELNQPLTGLRLYAEVLLRRSTGQEREQLQCMVAQTERMMRIVDHLRHVGRDVPLELTAVTIDQPVNSCLELLGDQLRAKGIAVAVELPDGLPPVRADSRAIEQVVINLLTNARDALEEGVGDKQVAISARPDESARGLVLEVRDSGPGIPAGVAEHIFDPFYSSKEPGKGSGLGLAISHGIVERHGGRLELADAGPGRTRFELWLPLAEQAAVG